MLESKYYHLDGFTHQRISNKFRNNHKHTLQSPTWWHCTQLAVDLWTDSVCMHHTWRFTGQVNHCDLSGLVFHGRTWAVDHEVEGEGCLRCYRSGSPRLPGDSEPGLVMRGFYLFYFFRVGVGGGWGGVLGASGSTLLINNDPVCVTCRNATWKKIMFFLHHKSYYCPLFLVMFDKLVGTLYLRITGKDAAFTVGNGGVMLHVSALFKQSVHRIMSSMQVKQMEPFFDLMMSSMCNYPT